jgi:RNA polymerase sigma-70 factor (ECF subfamily)
MARISCSPQLQQAQAMHSKLRPLSALGRGSDQEIVNRLKRGGSWRPPQGSSDPFPEGHDTGAAMNAQAPTPNRTDGEAELATALIAGDPAAPRAVWQKFLPLVRRMSRRALGSGSEVDDVVQEVFCSVFRGIRRLREPDAFRAFVITVTKRTLGHEVRRRRARLRLTTVSETHVAEAIGEWRDPATHHAYRHFELLLGRLKKRERQAFVLRFVERMDAPEVAETLGVSIPTARRAFSRAQTMLTLWAGRHPFLSDYVFDAAPASASGMAALETNAAA